MVLAEFKRMKTTKISWWFFDTLKVIKTNICFIEQEK
jgi:hypothetical protein